MFCQLFLGKSHLLESYAASRVDVRDDECGQEERQCRCEEGDDIDHDDPCWGEENGNGVDIIGGCIEAYEVEAILKNAETDAQDVANYHASPDDEDGIIEEDVAKGTIVGT